MCYHPRRKKTRIRLACASKADGYEVPSLLCYSEYFFLCVVNVSWRHGSKVLSLVVDRCHEKNMCTKNARLCVHYFVQRIVTQRRAVDGAACASLNAHHRFDPPLVTDCDLVLR